MPLPPLDLPNMLAYAALYPRASTQRYDALVRARQMLDEVALRNPVRDDAALWILFVASLDNDHDAMYDVLCNQLDAEDMDQRPIRPVCEFMQNY